MTPYIPLIVAFIGAAFGAFFAIIKTKRETVWLERYRLVSELIESNRYLWEHFSDAEMDRAGMSTRMKAEDEQMGKMMGEEMVKLRRNKVRLEVFFSGVLLEYLQERVRMVEQSIFDLLNHSPDEDYVDYTNSISTHAEENTKLFTALQSAYSVSVLPNIFNPVSKRLINQAKVWANTKNSA